MEDRRDGKGIKEFREMQRIGESICMKIKKWFYPGNDWGDCHKEIAAQFTEARRRMRKHYPNKSELERYMKLDSFDQPTLTRLLKDETKSDVKTG